MSMNLRILSQKCDKCGKETVQEHVRGRVVRATCGCGAMYMTFTYTRTIWEKAADWLWIATHFMTRGAVASLSDRELQFDEALQES